MLRIKICAEFNSLFSSIIFIIVAFVLLIEVDETINVPFSCHFLDFYCFSKSHSNTTLSFFPLNL